MCVTLIQEAHSVKVMASKPVTKITRFAVAQRILKKWSTSPLDFSDQINQVIANFWIREDET